MRWKPRLGTAGAIFLGLVLLVATWAKGLEPGAFAEQIRLEELDFLFSARIVGASVGGRTGNGLGVGSSPNLGFNSHHLVGDLFCFSHRPQLLAGHEWFTRSRCRLWLLRQFAGAYGWRGLLAGCAPVGASSGAFLPGPPVDPPGLSLASSGCRLRRTGRSGGLGGDQSRATLR